MSPKHLRVVLLLLAAKQNLFPGLNFEAHCQNQNYLQSTLPSSARFCGAKLHKLALWAAFLFL